MMSETVIRVEGLGKRYRIGERERYLALRDVISRALRAPARLLAGPSNGSSRRGTNLIWALKDICLGIRQGEVVGLIGRNGAGKSTLLKILARITRPTEGSAEIRGRIGSLLEVGTGFHPELTGRENVYLSGAILGMKKAEIHQKFDEIIAFSEVERFLDTPLKHYSSGMQMRLAFAVAAHLEPEILLVDEVLAVGDMAFQKKCLGKMEDVARGGRTVVFVSHNMAAVTRLCQRGVLLDGGRIILDSTVLEASAQYLNSGLGTSAERRWDDIETSPGNAVVRLRAVRVISEGVVSDNVDIRKSVTIEMEFYNFKEGAELFSAFSFLSDQGVILFVSVDFDEQQWGSKPRPVGLFHSKCTVPGNLFAEGQVRVIAEVSTRHPFYEVHFLEHDAVSFQVIDKGEKGSVRASWGRNLPGVVRPFLQWENVYVDRD
jgi:lipopolysaccharide transport system ATP-binding protein